MAALIAFAAIIVVSGILLGGFFAVCRRIRRTDQRGTLRPLERRHMLAYAARWDDNPPALA